METAQSCCPGPPDSAPPYCGSPSWRQGVVDALLAYSTGSGDWSGVETAFVNGWATQYQLQEG